MKVPPILLALCLTTSPLLGAGNEVGVPGETTSEPGIHQGVPVLGLHLAATLGSNDGEAIRRAVEAELGIVTGAEPATSYPVGRLTVEGGSRSVLLRFESADGVTKLERRVALPQQPARRVQVIAWVAGNLVRNEASEILAQWTSKPAAAVEPDAMGETVFRATEAAGAAAVEETRGTAETVETQGVTKPPNPTKAVIASAPASGVRLENAAFDVTSKDALGPSANRLWHLGLLSPWLEFDHDASLYRYRLSFDVLYGDIGALDGFGLGMLVDRIRKPSSGVQISGLWLEGNGHRGVVVSGLGLHARGDVVGAEVAGLVALRFGKVEGAQISGGANFSQLGVTGVEAATGANVSLGSVQGAQVATGLNVAGDLTGLQLGAVNVARDVKGLQLGFVNVAKSNRGLALGLFNWSEGARLQPIYFFQTPEFHNAGYRVLSGWSTGSVSFGYDPGRKQGRTHFAVGVRKAYGRLGLGVEAGYGWVLEHLTVGPSDRAHELDLTAHLSADVLRNLLSVYGGLGLRQPVAGVVPLEPHALGQLGLSLF